MSYPAWSRCKNSRNSSAPKLHAKLSRPVLAGDGGGGEVCQGGFGEQAVAEGVEGVVVSFEGSVGGVLGVGAGVGAFDPAVGAELADQVRAGLLHDGQARPRFARFDRQGRVGLQQPFDVFDPFVHRVIGVLAVD